MAWVLVIGIIGYNNAFAVSGIASEAECRALGAKLYAEATMNWPKWQCYSYQATR